VDVIFPVAGLGTRLRPLTWSKPKPLVSVAGKPILEHVIDRVAPANPDSFVFITGFLGEQIESWARQTYEVPMEFVEQPQMLGQTDAIIRTRELCKGAGLILFPDMVFEADFTGLASTDADAVIYTKEVDDPSAFGVVVTDADGKITTFIEKPDTPVSNQAVVGIYYFRHMPDLYDAIDEQMERKMMLKNEYFIADAIQIMIDRGKKVITAPVTAWEDCGNIEVLLNTNRYLLDRASNDSERERALIIPPSFVAEDAVVEDSIVGPYASIGSGSTVRDAIVRDAIVESGATIQSAIIEHSVVGRGAAVSGQPVEVRIGDNSVTKW
jgi:glucose-1-phosphate thymidylyltransferase